MLSCVAIVVPYKINSDSSVSYWFQRRVGGEFDGLREFPGGKLEPNEALIHCALRELQEETGVQITEAELSHYTTLSIPVPRKTISMGIFLTKSIDKFDPTGIETIVDVERLEEQLPTLPANYQIIRDLHNYLLS